MYVEGLAIYILHLIDNDLTTSYVAVDKEVGVGVGVGGFLSSKETHAEPGQQIWPGGSWHFSSGVVRLMGIVDI